MSPGKDSDALLTYAGDYQPLVLQPPAPTDRPERQKLSGIRTDVERLKSFAILRLWNGELTYAVDGTPKTALETLTNACSTVGCRVK